MSLGAGAAAPRSDLGHFASQMMSALSSKADIAGCDSHVRFVPKADIAGIRQQKRRPVRIYNNLI
jgi:hypothetical protein